MPVRRPRWPTAVSAAFEAYGGPRPQLRAELDEPPRPPIGEVTSLSVGVSVSRWVCRSSLVWGSIDRLRLPCLGPSVRPGDQGFGNDRTQVFGCLVFVCVWWSVCGSVCVCLSTRPSPQVPLQPPVLFCPVLLALTCGCLVNGRSPLVSGSCLYHARAAATRLEVRCALFSGFVFAGLFSSRNRDHRGFCAASPTSALLSRRACYVREGGSGVHTDQNSR